MKKIRMVFIALFFVLLAVPVVTFNREKDVISEIDNRKLMENPFEAVDEEGKVDVTNNLEDYAQDRIGLRSEMITAYMNINEALFHEMVHPSYTWGKDGYVFFHPGDKLDFQEYHLVFAQMVKKVQDYCEERGVPFLFVVEPAKMTVLQDKLADGICYDNSWLPKLEEELERLGVNYIDNTDLLYEKTASGEMVFNKQYDAGHWNDLGAFYGTNHILEALSKIQEGVHVNTRDEFETGTEVMTVLPQSEFKIHDEVPVFTRKQEVEDLTEQYGAEVARNSQYPYFEYTVNPARKNEGAPKALIFQGSYMNVYGAKFLENSFAEYIAVHDYQNVMNLDYYFNIFQPDCVVFEVAEYAMLDDYFSFDTMKAMELNPALSSFDVLPQTEKKLAEDMLWVEEGNTLATVYAAGINDSQYAYLEMNGKVFDLRKQEDGSFAAAVDKKELNLEKASITVVTKENPKEKVVYK